MKNELPFWGKLAYAAGAGGWCLIDRLLITWLLYFYVVRPAADGQVLVSAFAFGAIMLLGRVVDAIADPLVAKWSDNHGGRLGRRVPFLLGSGVLYLAVFLALFHPPFRAGSSLNAVYLSVGLAAYFTLFTVYVTPYLALLPELARSMKDRVDLTTWKAAFSILGVAAAFVGGGILIDAVGMQGMLFLAAALALVLLYIPALIRERDHATSAPATPTTWTASSPATAGASSSPTTASRSSNSTAPSAGRATATPRPSARLSRRSRRRVEVRRGGRLAAP
ncbi:MAG: MFS transporter [Myxococcota bacterium]